MFLAKGSRSTKLIWGLLFLCQSIVQISTLYKVNGYISEWSFLFRLGFPFSLATATLVYLYILSLIQPDFKISEQSPWHLIPFLIGLVWYFSANPWTVSVPSIDSVEFSQDMLMRNTTLLFAMAFYLFLSERAVRSFEKSLMNQRSSLAETKLSWLKSLILVCYLGVALIFIDVFTGQALLLWRFRGIVPTFALVVLTFFGLRLSRFFEQDLKPNNESNISADELKLLSARLKKCLMEEKLYLQPQFRLSDLAEKMNIKAYRLSEVINRGLKTNFYELINGLRLDHAKALLSDPKYNSMSILGIAMDSGFNSKSVFNDYFRHHVGMPPSEFRARHII